MQLLQFSCSAVRSVFSCGPLTPPPPLPHLSGGSSECWQVSEGAVVGGVVGGVCLGLTFLFIRRKLKEKLKVAY